eukprot:gene440-892_t
MDSDSDFESGLGLIDSDDEEALEEFFESKSDGSFKDIVDEFVSEEEEENDATPFGWRPKILTFILREVISREICLDDEIMHSIVYLIARWPDRVDALQRFRCLDVNVVAKVAGLHDEYDTTPLMKALLLHEKERVESLLAHPMIQVNKQNSMGQTAVHYCRAPDCLDMLLSDPRVHLSSQDAYGGTIMDIIWLLWEDEADHIDNMKKIIRSHELTRLTKAKKDVSILKQVLPEDILSEHVLPFHADVISPLEEIGGNSLQ